MCPTLFDDRFAVRVVCMIVGRNAPKPLKVLHIARLEPYFGTYTSIFVGEGGPNKNT